MLKVRWFFVIGCVFIIALGACGVSPTPVPVQPTLPPAATASATQIAYPPPAATLPASIAYPPPDLTKTAGYTPLPTRPPFPTFTPRPTVASSSTPVIPTPIPGLEPEPVQIISPNDFISDSSKLHDLILFETSGLFPFNPEKYSLKFRSVLDGVGQSPERDGELWAISPDGKRMGRLTLPGLNSKIFIPQSAVQKPGIVEYGIHLDNPGLKAVALPAECYSVLNLSDPEHGLEYYHCRNFKFSPDGLYLSYTHDESNCNRLLSILDVATGKLIYQKTVNSLYPEFVSKDKMFINIGHCEGGGSLFVDLKTGKEQEAGDYAWDYDWNTSHSAFLVAVGPYAGFIGRSFWGYNNLTGQLFSPPQINYSLQSPSTWVPDGTYILYEQREFTYEEFKFKTTPKGTSSLMRYDFVSGKAQVILSDPRYDYWLCVSQFMPCKFKHPDWIQVARSPVPTDPVELINYQEAVINCIQEGQCFKDPELFALNWRTGQLLPWDQVPSAPIPTPASQYKNRGNDFKPLPPDRSSRLVYAHPSGDYAFYVGADGTSLWRVVKGGQSVVWVENGENFIYLP